MTHENELPNYIEDENQVDGSDDHKGIGIDDIERSESGEEKDIPKLDFNNGVAMRALRADLKKMVKGLGVEEVRSLIDTYYMLQRDRIRLGNRIGAIKRGVSSDQPPLVLSLFNEEVRALETLMVTPIRGFVEGDEVGRWMLSQKGIGPILAGSFLSHFDITKARGSGAFIRFAGLDPTLKWEKGQKRPFNAFLKKTCFLLGESLVKVKNRKDAFYGNYYDQRKIELVTKNEAGLLKSSADRYLENITQRGVSRGYNTTDEDVANKTKEWIKVLQTGKLPPFLLDKQARRKAVALFIAHLHDVMYENHYGKPPEFRPYVFDILGHKDFIKPYNWPVSKLGK